MHISRQLMDSRLLVDPCIESEYEIGRSIRANNKRYVRKRREHKEQLAIASRTTLGQAEYKYLLWTVGSLFDGDVIMMKMRGKSLLLGS